MKEKILIGWLNAHPNVTELDVWMCMAVLNCGYSTVKDLGGIVPPRYFRKGGEEIYPAFQEIENKFFLSFFLSFLKN